MTIKLARARARLRMGLPGARSAEPRKPWIDGFAACATPARTPQRKHRGQHGIGTCPSGAVLAYRSHTPRGADEIMRHSSDLEGTGRAWDRRRTSEPSWLMQNAAVSFELDHTPHPPTRQVEDGVIAISV